MHTMRAAARFAVILVLCGVAGQALAQAAKTQKPAENPKEDPKVVYCRATGGLVEVRHAVYGTNNPRQDWLWLGAEEDFCQYTASDGSRIHISLETLTQTRPTLAALAYYAQIPWNGKVNGNPASFYCTQ